MKKSNTDLNKQAIVNVKVYTDLLKKIRQVDPISKRYRRITSLSGRKMLLAVYWNELENLQKEISANLFTHMQKFNLTVNLSLQRKKLKDEDLVLHELRALCESYTPQDVHLRAVVVLPPKSKKIGTVLCVVCKHFERSTYEGETVPPNWKCASCLKDLRDRDDMMDYENTQREIVPLPPTTIHDKLFHTDRFEKLLGVPRLSMVEWNNMYPELKERRLRVVYSPGNVKKHEVNAKKRKLD